jgi:hypothetical protein
MTTDPVRRGQGEAPGPRPTPVPIQPFPCPDCGEQLKVDGEHLMCPCGYRRPGMVMLWTTGTTAEEIASSTAERPDTQ